MRKIKQIVFLLILSNRLISFDVAAQPKKRFVIWQKPAVITDQGLDELIGTIREMAPNCLINRRICLSPDVADKVDFPLQLLFWR